MSNEGTLAARRRKKKTLPKVPQVNDEHAQHQETKASTAAKMRVVCNPCQWTEDCMAEPYGTNISDIQQKPYRQN
jgi:hypothetical protein